MKSNLSFSGLLLAGLPLFLSMWGPLVVAVMLIPLQVQRARKEERVLAAAFGEKYQIYKRSTWFEAGTMAICGTDVAAQKSESPRSSARLTSQSH